MDAVIYARYSSHNQREESIEGQLRECHAYADRHGLNIIAEYCDYAISGTTDQRPQFQAMIKASANKKFQVVLLYAVDRFARDRYDSAFYKRILQKNGVKCVYVTTPLNDDPESVLLESIMEGYAEYYSRNLARSIRRGMTENALKGLATNAPPLGYRIEDHRYVIDPFEADTVRTIFRLVADGNTFASISRYLNERGIRTKTGGLFNKNSFHALLHNEKYIGIYRFNDIVRDDIIEPIIDRELWDAAHKQLEMHRYRRGKHETAKDKYMLTGKVFCGECESPMIGESGTSSTGKVYTYYKCSAQKFEKTCHKKPVKKKWLEDIVIDALLNIVLGPENIEILTDRTFYNLSQLFCNDEFVEELRNEEADVRKRLDNLIRATEQGAVGKTINARIEALETQLDAVLKRIEEEESKKPSFTREHVYYWLLSFKKGDIEDQAFRENLIKYFLNKVYVFDSPNGGHRIKLLFNTVDNNTAEMYRSDNDELTPPLIITPNCSLVSIWLGEVWIEPEDLV